jgi:predicted membrane protein DUF2232
MLRKLSAIEIAEGALLADIAVVFQLLFIYLPVGGAFFSLLIPPLFTILVLRRGFYAAVMGVCVAIFIVGVITGFHSVLLTLLECGAGIFLGVTMRLRLHYIPLILIGTTGSAFFLLCTTLVTILLLGQPFLDVLLQGLRNGYTGAFSVLAFITPQLGLGGWWHNIYPAVRHLADLTLKYWLVLLYVGNWIVACPAVIVVYYITTFLVRLLGYDVRPFPDGRVNKLIQWFIHLLVRMALKLGLGKYWITRTLIKEFRRQSMGLGRQKANT